MSSNSCASRVPSPDTDASHDPSAHDQRRPPTPERAAGRAAVVAHLVVPLNAAQDDDASKRGDALNHHDEHGEQRGDAVPHAGAGSRSAAPHSTDSAHSEMASRSAAHSTDAAHSAVAAHGDVLVLTVDAAQPDPPVGAALVGDHPGGEGLDGVARPTGDAPDGHGNVGNEAGGEDARGAVGGLDTGGVESAIIDRLDAAVEALDEVDFARWSDAALSGHLDEVSLVLCRVDAQLSRLADAVRSRGFAVAEVDLPLAS